MQNSPYQGAFSTELGNLPGTYWSVNSEKGSERLAYQASFPVDRTERGFDPRLQKVRPGQATA
jgi:hypothetical protein